MSDSRRGGYDAPMMGPPSVATSRLGGLVQRLPRPAVLSKFAFTGAVVGLTHIGLVSLLVVAGVPIQLALALAYAVALVLHFTLNRQWVFAADSGYALHFSAQGVRYLIAAAISYAGTAVGVAVLPGALGIPDLAAFFLMTAVMACITFAILHLWVFRPAPDEAA